jgi:hypothetical protein
VTSMLRTIGIFASAGSGAGGIMPEPSANREREPA